MDKLEILLRNEFADPPTSDLPLASELIASAHRIRRRRRALAGIATVMAVASVVAVSVVVGGSSRPIRPTLRPQVAPLLDPSALASLDAKFVADIGTVEAGRFVDAQHGFVELRRCIGVGRAATCTNVLEASDDGGSTFVRRTVPATTTLSELYIFDAAHLVLDSYALKKQIFTVQKRWTSSDGGVSWQSVSARPSGTASTIPAGGQLFASGGTAAESQIFALTSDGRAVGLPNVPHSGLVGQDVGWPSSTAGTYEVDGAYLTTDHGPNRQGRLWSSADRGASWTRAKLPSPVDAGGGGGSNDAMAVVGGSGRMFLIADQDNSNNQDPPYLAASTDGGRTWTNIETPIPSNGPDEEAGLDYSAAGLPGGGLVLAGDDQLWRLSSQGLDWTSIDDGLVTRQVYGLGDVVVAVRGSAAHLGLYVTADGTHWRKSTMN